MAKYGLQSVTNNRSSVNLNGSIDESRNAMVAANSQDQRHFRGQGGILSNKLIHPSPIKSPSLEKLFNADGGMLGSVLPDGQIGPSQEKLILEDARKFNNIQDKALGGVAAKPT